MQRAEASVSASDAPAPALIVPNLRRRRRVMQATLALVVIALGAAAYVAWRGNDAPVDTVRTERVARRTIVRTVAITGHLDVERRVEVAAPTAGRLNTIDAMPGDVVVEGQPLAHLDERWSELSLGSARASLTMASSQVTSARIARDAARTELARLDELIARGLASAADRAGAQARVEQSETALRAANAQRDAAQTGLETAQLGHQYTVLRAPIAGVVLRAPQNVGAIVGPERGALFVIGSDLSALRLDGSIGEADVGDVHAGQTATFEVPAYVGRVFNATVTQLEPQANIEPGATTYPIHFRADNPDGALRQGMSAMVRIEVARAENALSVPEAALRFTPAGAEEAAPRSRVWRRDGPNRLTPVAVVAGISDGAYTVVTPADPSALTEEHDVAIAIEVQWDTGGLSLGGR